MKRLFVLALAIAGCTSEAPFRYPDLSGAAAINFPDGGLALPDGAPDLEEVDLAEGAATLAADQTTLGFGKILDGTRSSDLSLTISNSGFASLISGVSVSGDGFVLAKESCIGETLSGSSTCSASVRFEPLAAGDATGMLVVSGSAGGNLTVSLSGQGVAPGAIAFTPASYGFGSVSLGSGKDGRFGLQNTGLIDSGPISLQISGASSNTLWISADNCDPGLSAGASCSVTVHFQGMSTTPISATLTATDAQGGTATVAITGTGS
jgi:hypothetical protein